MSLGQRISAGIGAPAARLAAIAAIVGGIALVVGVALGVAAPAVAALLASWLFFAGLAAGSVAVAAAIRIAYGRWAAPLLPIAEASTAFFVPAFVLLLVVLAGHHVLVHGQPLAPIAIRLIVASAVVFALGWNFVAVARTPGADPSRVRRDALLYIFAYVVGLSIWAHDLVMKLSEGPPFTVVPPYYFMGAFLCGLAWVALVAALRDVSGPDLRHDIGKLLFAFIIVWTYLLWALFLPTWYGNIPEEVAVLLRRWRGPWKPVTLLVLVATFAWPFWLLFSETLKRRRETLAVGAATILLGLWGERFLLVLPSLDLPGGALPVAVGAGVALGVAGAFLLSLGARIGARGVLPDGATPPA